MQDKNDIHLGDILKVKQECSNRHKKHCDDIESLQSLRKQVDQLKQEKDDLEQQIDRKR